MSHSFEVLALVWREMLWGTALLFFCAVLGWVTGRYRRLPPVRGLSWWMGRVVLPLIGVRSWWTRTVIIFVNNAGILAGILLVARSRLVATIAVAAVGWTLGIALRVLGQMHLEWTNPGPAAPEGVRRRVRIGVLVNLLEPPAIAATVGLALGRTALGLPELEAWGVFGKVVVPLLVVAAGGEALWIGAGLRGNR